MWGVQLKVLCGCANGVLVTTGARATFDNKLRTMCMGNSRMFATAFQIRVKPNAAAVAQ